MKESEARKIFLKQAKPFFKRYEAEQKRKHPARGRRTFDFKACITPGVSPLFAASYEDLFRGKQSMRVPILFALPFGSAGFAFTSASEFDKFKKLCEGK